MSWRKMTIRDEVWLYQFGKQNAVIKSPSGKKVVVTYSKLTGKYYFDSSIGDAATPQHVKNYIIKHLDP